MKTNTFPVVLDDTFMLTPSVKHFSFHSKQESTFNYIPGQFIRIHFEHEGKLFRRSYSISNPPKSDNRIEFAASFVKDGPGTNLLFNLKIGDTIDVSGPFGKLILKEQTPKRYIFIATSTGVTPFRAMMPELENRLNANPDLSCIIMLGVQKRQDVLYSQEFQDWAARLAGRVEFKACLSRETLHELESHEIKGHVQDGFADINLNPDEDVVYLCGNPAMIDDSYAILTEKGFTTQNIIREKYISSK
ncbi:MAG: ferredoxin--NADP reductase [Legionellaceae bacterium]|nr:ferredoxin--NADP reductase [Legionellaceae bacterium]